ncbi:uncharacterized protein UV8b_05743 [Ustilaginoidea virens]|uniref:Uncharacterized protein n=1 Tax=Ustilaginoidea virens TaxID=1159556 RepID=A0A8E5HTT7_USTVR|nr:uncharacterized protein UV8b_05743 [Ustilaginoidea virens]QUC21500.1 hypothetical protein UV8b_05743 [Ustilaginoidea virens]
MQGYPIQSVYKAPKKQRQTGIARGDIVPLDLDFLCHLESQVATARPRRGESPQYKASELLNIHSNRQNII